MRLLQICDDLSVCFADSSPGRGAFPLRRVHPSGASRQLPLTRGALDLRTLKASPCQGEVPSKARRRGYSPQEGKIPPDFHCTFY